MMQARVKPIRDPTTNHTPPYYNAVAVAAKTTTTPTTPNTFAVSVDILTQDITLK